MAGTISHGKKKVPVMPVMMNTGGGGTPDADECPAVSRPQSNQGCPEVKEEVRKRLAFAAKVIQFATGIATIKKQSYTALNEIANILDKYPGQISWTNILTIR